jgi:hypothetical protein
MSHAMNEHERALRDALRAAAQQIEPRADGLERIQARLRRPHPLPVAWLLAAWNQLELRLPDGLRAAGGRLGEELGLVSRQFMPDSGRRGTSHPGRSWLGWARPVAAMSTAVFIVAAVVYMAIKVPQVISPTGNAATATHSGGSAKGGGAGHGSPQTLTQGGSHSAGQSGHGSRGTANGQSCSTSPSPGMSSLNPGPSTTPTTTPPSTTSPSPTPTPTASGTPSTTPSTGSSSTPAGAGTTPVDGSEGSPAPTDDAGTQAADHLAGRSAQDRTARDTSAFQTVPGAQQTPCPSPTTHKAKKSSSRKMTPNAAGLIELSAPGTTAETAGRLT